MDEIIITKTFKKYLKKSNAEKLAKHIINFCEIYAEENNAEFILNDIIKTKVDYLESLCKKNDFLINSINNKEINIDTICYLPEYEIDPEKFKHIIERRQIEELRKSQQEDSTAFKCNKCGAKRSKVTERQTRAGDEPATIYITCLECENVIRF